MVMVYYVLEHFFPHIKNSLRLANINKKDIALIVFDFFDPLINSEISFIVHFLTYLTTNIHMK